MQHEYSCIARRLGLLEHERVEVTPSLRCTDDIPVPIYSLTHQLHSHISLHLPFPDAICCVLMMRCPGRAW